MKSCGLADVISEALASISSQITAAFVYGSVVRGQDTAESDVDLMLVSEDLTHGDIFGVLEAAEALLGRPINPTIYSRQELTKRLRDGNSFVERTLSQPKLWIIGGEDDIAA